jgi:hypothetical protein
VTQSFVTVPDHVREELRRVLWEKADALGWSDLSASDKTRHYEHWTQDVNVGGTLARYMDPPRVRVYLKDAVFKPYSRAKLGDWVRCARALGLESEPVAESFIKPHGRRLSDGRVISWGPASSWKAVLMALHERTFGRDSTEPCAAVFLRAIGRYREDRARRMVEDAAAKLNVKRVVWLET